MGEGYNFLDIILLAMVAGFIALRLRSVLGRRTGHEAPPPPRPLPRDGTPERQREAGVVVPLPAPAVPAAVLTDPTAAGLARIQDGDAAFRPEEFVAGAKAAYEMIVIAYAKGDKDTLRPLLGDDAYASFAQGIDERQTKGQVQETTLVALRQAEIVRADLKGRLAEVVVRFVAELINTTRDAGGGIVAGNPNAPEEVIDLWTFGRDPHSRDPNWLLMATSPAG